MAYPHLDFTMGSIETWLHTLADAVVDVENGDTSLATETITKYKTVLAVEIELPEGPQQVFRRDEALRNELRAVLAEEAGGRDRIDERVFKAKFEELLHGQAFQKPVPNDDLPRVDL